ncbi:MAG: hypothetical protein Q4E59_02765 [Bacteroidales bacterium]|nr:hypothetical protein [Bacteroidales bacterium]
MILFVFEGDEREPNFYRTLEKLYFPKNNNNIICSFGNNIYELYNEMMELEGDGDIISVMKERLSRKGDTTLEKFKSSDFSEIYLFFDYDFQNTQLTLDQINERMKQMLELFSEETDCGKLYVNYPMLESIRYVKELPDDDYYKYEVDRQECTDFKRLSGKFSCFDNLDFLIFKKEEKPSHERYMRIRENWEILRTMNVSKANYLISGENAMPKNKADVGQMAVFEAQITKYVLPKNSVSVLNSFPIFIYEYLK